MSDSETLEKDPQFAYTLARGLEVLSAFKGPAADLSNREIAERIGVPRSTVARLTRTLSLLGYLAYDANRNRYRMTAAMLTLAYPMLAQLPIRQTARPLMQQLANYAQGSVSLGLREAASLVLIESAVGPKAITRPDIGATRPIVSTAFGFAFLAGLSGPVRDALVKEFSGSMELASAASRRAWRAQLDEQVQHHAATGFCLVRHPEISTIAVGVPIKAADGVMMAINCAVASHEADTARMENDIGPRLVRLARDLETLMGVTT